MKTALITLFLIAACSGSDLQAQNRNSSSNNPECNITVTPLNDSTYRIDNYTGELKFKTHPFKGTPVFRHEGNTFVLSDTSKYSISVVIIDEKRCIHNKIYRKP